MISENFFYIIIALIGLDFALRYRHHGRVTIQSQRKLNKIIPTHNKKDFDEKAIKRTQIAYLIGGVAAVVISLMKLFANI